MPRRTLAMGLTLVALVSAAASQRVQRPEITAHILSRLADRTKTRIERVPSTGAETITIYRLNSDGTKAGTWGTLKRRDDGSGEFYNERLNIRSYHGVWINETTEAKPCYAVSGMPEKVYAGDLALMCVTVAKDNLGGGPFTLGEPDKQSWKDWQNHHRSITSYLQANATDVKPE